MYSPRSLKILTVFSSGLFLLSCQKASEPAKVSAIVLFKVGSVMAGGKELSNGDIVRKGTEIVLGAQSLVDLQIREAASSITMRIQENSRFTLEARNGKDGPVLSPFLQTGGVLTRVEKLRGSDSYEVRTPSAIAAVRGTKFEAHVAPDGTSNLIVLDGKVAARPRAAAVENLPPELVAKNAQLGQLVSALEKSETVVESGQAVQVEKKVGDQLVRDAGVEAILSQPQMQSLQAGQSKPEDIQKAQAALEAHFASAENQERVRAAAAKPPQAPVTTRIEDEELKRKLQEYEEFVAREEAAAKNETEAQKAVTSVNQEQRTIQMRRIENIMGKTSETLVLKDGTRVQGVIIQTGMDYIVLTPEGKVFYSSAQVQSLEF